MTEIHMYNEVLMTAFMTNSYFLSHTLDTHHPPVLQYPQGGDHMIEISIDQFNKDQDKHIGSVLGEGNIIAVNTEHGKIVMMEVAEYKILRQAFEILLQGEK
jgi:hypothetical protein